MLFHSYRRNEYGRNNNNEMNKYYDSAAGSGSRRPKSLDELTYDRESSAMTASGLKNNRDRDNYAYDNDNNYPSASMNRRSASPNRARDRTTSPKRITSSTSTSKSPFESDSRDF